MFSAKVAVDCARWRRAGEGDKQAPGNCGTETGGEMKGRGYSSWRAGDFSGVDQSRSLLQCEVALDLKAWVGRNPFSG